MRRRDRREDGGKSPELIAEELIAEAKRTGSTELDLSDLGLEQVPNGVWEMTGLTALDLSGNLLTSLPEGLGALTELSLLSLSGNQLTSLPTSIGRLTKLTYLGVSDNSLTSLPETVGGLTKLSSLYLRGNQLGSLPDAIGNLTQLTQVYLFDNLLTSLPPGIARLKRLTLLSLQRNRLQELPEAMRDLDALEELYLHGNDQLGLPADVLGPTYGETPSKTPAHPAVILEYYLRTRQGARPLNEAKLILVGRGEVGKTCLVNRLVKDRFRAGTEKTKGIQITNWELPCEPDPVQLHIWDFGGQEIMHATHQFFLTERSLYLLVLNGREDREDEDVEYWLKLIQSFGGDSPVIVVLNKIAEHDFDVNYPDVKRKYPQVRGFLKTDCKLPVGIDELRQEITNAIGLMPSVRADFPSAWFSIKDELAHMKRNLKQNYIGYDRYRELCTKQGEADHRAQDDLAWVLHCLGIALNYRDDDRLNETSLLNPHWVTNGIYRLLNAPELKASKGVLDAADLGRLLPARQYPAKKHPFIVGLMRKFQLCFPFPDDTEHRYLIPELLDKQEPDLGAEFDPEQCLNFEYSYGVLPEGLLPTFIVRSHVLSEGQQRWRFGVVLEWQGCRALVKADMPEKRITVNVRGGNEASRRELLAVIRSDFDSMHGEIPALPFTELVPVPSHPEVKIEYGELVAFEQARRRQYPKLVDGKVIGLSVKKLLGGVELALPVRPKEVGLEREERVKLFISYSHKDEPFRGRMEAHLKLLERQQKLVRWDDHMLSRKEKFGPEIAAQLDAAHIIVFLVSADFFNSDYCFDIEMTRALNRWKTEGVYVVPVLVQPCDWKPAPFAGLNVLPKDAKPVAEWENPESAWTNVAVALRGMVEEIIEARKST